MPRNAEVIDRSGRAWLRVELDPELKAEVLKAAIDERITLKEFTAQALAEKVARIKAKKEAGDSGDPPKPVEPRGRRRRG